MKTQLFFLSALLSAGMNSCVREVDPDFRDFASHYVVNAVMNPDSAIRVNLGKSIRADQNGIFPAVNDALVEISGADFSARLTPAGNGNYLLEKHPAAGTVFQLKVTCPDGTILRASTRIPGKPFTEIKPLAEENYLRVTIHDLPAEEDVYWVGIRSFQSHEKRYFFETSVESDFLQFDDFNRGRTTDRFGRNTFYYQFYARLPDFTFSGKEAVFKIPWFWIPEGEPVPGDWINYIYIINADRHLDQYMKAALIQYDLGVVGDMPVFYTPIDIYGNVSGGKGIFGSCTLCQFEIINP